MEWDTTWEDPLTSYVKQFAGLIRAVAFSGRKTIRTGHPQGDTLFEW
jgi:hypothetical protein